MAKKEILNLPVCDKKDCRSYMNQTIVFGKEKKENESLLIFDEEITGSLGPLQCLICKYHINKFDLYRKKIN